MACLSCNLIPLSLTFIFSPWVVMTGVTYCLKQSERKLASPTQDRRGMAGLFWSLRIRTWPWALNPRVTLAPPVFLPWVHGDHPHTWGAGVRWLWGRCAALRPCSSPLRAQVCAGLTAGPGLPTRTLPRSAAALPSSLHLTLVLAAVGCWGMSGREFPPASATEHVPKERVPRDSNIYNWLNVKSL